MKVLGIDPGNKRTAFAVVSEDGPEYLRDFTLELQRKKEADQMQARIELFYAELDNVLKQFPEVLYIAMEKVDWHQHLGSRTFNYQRERLTQAAMAQFKTMLVTYRMVANARIGRSIETVFVGANEWKLQFGASTKDGVMEQCHIRYQDLILWDRAKGSYTWAKDGHILKDHETDAIAIATVALNQMIHPELENFARVRGRR